MLTYDWTKNGEQVTIRNDVVHLFSHYSCEVLKKLRRIWLSDSLLSRYDLHDDRIFGKAIAGSMVLHGLLRVFLLPHYSCCYGRFSYEMDRHLFSDACMFRVRFRQNLAHKEREICREEQTVSVEQIIAVLKQVEVWCRWPRCASKWEYRADLLPLKESRTWS
jgi:hypothetical protein